MKKWINRLALPVAAVVISLAWIVHFHNAWVLGKVPQWTWLQKTIGHFGQAVAAPAADDDDDPDNTKNEIPVHVANVSVATLHRYIDGVGMVTPRAARQGQMAGSATVVSPLAGMVAKVACELGQKVHAGDTLIQLDDRLAKAAQDQAEAALAQARAARAILQATPRPEQVQIAQLAIDKAQAAVAFAQKNSDRQTQLAADQGTSAKNVEQAAVDLAAAKNDLSTAQKQMDVLKASPTPEELLAEEAKVRQAEAGLATATLQRQMLTITAPIDGTVVSLAVNLGESVDTTRTLVELVAMDRLMVDMDVPVDQLPAKAEGMKAELFSNGGAGAEASDAPAAAVSFVDSQVEPKNGSVMLGIDLPADTALLPGQTVRVRIVAAEHKDVLAVPREAVVLDENGDHVISIVEGNEATHRTVKVGLEEGGVMEITSDGIKEGTTVVTTGAFGLRETQKTRIRVME